jgi:hypothetical protein
MRRNPCSPERALRVDDPVLGANWIETAKKRPNDSASSRS